MPYSNTSKLSVHSSPSFGLKIRACSDFCHFLVLEQLGVYSLTRNSMNIKNGVSTRATE